LVNIDTVMVGWFEDAESVGFYSAAQKPIALLYVLPSLIVGGFFPSLARFANEQKEKFREVLEKALTMIVTAAFPIAIGTMLIAEQIIELVYGSEYIPSAGALRILSLTVLTAFPIGIIIHAVFAHNRQKELVPLWIAGSIINILLNFMLIPRFGISGAAWASFVTQMGINSLIWLKMKRMSYFSIKKRIPHILLATFMMSVIILLAQQLGIHVIFVIALAIIGYLGSLTFSGENPLGQLRNVLNRT
jgi:O-antigen/teichoic acid export membrane protein